MAQLLQELQAAHQQDRCANQGRGVNCHMQRRMCLEFWSSPCGFDENYRWWFGTVRDESRIKQFFWDVNNSSFQKIMLGFVCSGMIDCQHESLEDSRWPDVLLFLWRLIFEPSGTESETMMNHEWKLKHRSTRVIFTYNRYIYIYRETYFILFYDWCEYTVPNKIYERYTVYCFSKRRSF